MSVTVDFFEDIPRRNQTSDLRVQIPCSDGATETLW